MKLVEIVAVKLEVATARYAQLLYESKIYKILSGGTGIPEIYWAGSEGDYNCMVMEMLGPSLEDLFQFCHQKFTIKTTAIIADQLI